MNGADGKQQALVVRFRGIGDVLISWFAVEMLTETHDVTYVTSSMAAEVFPDRWVNVVAYDWEDHPLDCVPELPAEVMGIPHDRLFNLVNAVDWRLDTPTYDTVSRAKQFARLMGVPTSDYLRSIELKEDERSAAEKLLFNVPRPRVCCQIDSSAETRHWLHWDRLAYLLEKEGYSVVYTGGNYRESPDYVHNLSGQTKMREWLGVLDACQVIVSPCTSAVHVGARLPNTRVVALYGSTDSRLFTEHYTNVTAMESYELPCSPCADWQIDTYCYKRGFAPFCLNSLSAEEVFLEVCS